MGKNKKTAAAPKVEEAIKTPAEDTFVQNSTAGEAGAGGDLLGLGKSNALASLAAMKYVFVDMKWLGVELE